MGLDITAYRRLSKVDEEYRDTEEFYDNRYMPHPASVEWAEQHFPGRSEGIEPGAVYAFEDAFGFRAGGYGGYNAWRRELAELAGYSAEDAHSGKVTSGPFYELVDFADNEGVIGPVVSAKLAADFRDHQHLVGDRGLFADLYGKWRKAFEMAADGGAVDFH